MWSLAKLCITAANEILNYGNISVQGEDAEKPVVVVTSGWFTEHFQTPQEKDT